MADGEASDGAGGRPARLRALLRPGGYGRFPVPGIQPLSRLYHAASPSEARAAVGGWDRRPGSEHPPKARRCFLTRLPLGRSDADRQHSVNLLCPVLPPAAGSSAGPWCWRRATLSGRGIAQADAHLCHFRRSRSQNVVPREGRGGFFFLRSCGAVLMMAACSCA